MVRLGEFTEHYLGEHGKHEDIDIVRSIQHENWDKKLLINDIAIVHLKRDVEFGGN